MNKHLPVLLLLLLLGAGTASAAGAKPSEAQLRYQQDRAKCMRGETNQDRATCLKEAGAALQESKNRTLGAAGESELQRNRLQRCDALPAPEREECAARMNDGTTSGSAQQGGVLRQVTSPAK
jgi:hypothetical protein